MASDGIRAAEAARDDAAVREIAKGNANIAILEDLRADLNDAMGYRAVAATVTEGATEADNREFWGQFWPVEAMDSADLAAYGATVRYDMRIGGTGGVYVVPANPDEGPGDAQRARYDMELALSVAKEMIGRE